jgi:hypothetical protein
VPSEPNSSGKEELSEYVRRPTRTAAICPRSLKPQRESQQKTLLVILKPPPLNKEL